MTTARLSRTRRRHQQLELVLKFDKNGQRRGGKRTGAGRKPKGKTAGSPHKKRADVDPRDAQHVTLRIVGDVGWLRRLDMYRAIRQALTTSLARTDFRIVHYSVQTNHVHLICEASDKDALAAGVKGFEVSAARRLNDVLTRRRGKRRRGQVFADRYHVEPVSTPTQARHVLAYVMNNWRRHGCDKQGGGLLGNRLDPFSSASRFEGWREKLPEHLVLPRDFEDPLVARAQTWLLAVGYKRGGPAVSMFEVPGRRSAASR